MIKQSTITEIFESSKIEDVVGDFVNLKKRGVNLLGLCPFHGEKTPSFTVSPAKNIYKCFGCGVGGNPVNFIMEHEGLTYPEALRYLAKKYNIAIEESETTDEQRQEKQLYDSLYLVNDFAQKYYEQQLFETERGKKIALSYFKERGFREETIRKFGLGYAPEKGNTFTLYAVNKGYKQDTLQKAGLTTSRGRDFFRDRVQFTIHNLTGKVVGFGGRILVKNVKAPKYLNTPESEIYNKSKILYGAYFAKRAIRSQDECIMVEGYTDVLSLHQSGIENVVASSGTSLTVDQIRLVKRYTPNIKIIYDGDPAGVKAALRGLDLVLEQDMNVRVVLLPQGEDPDSYLQKVGATAFREFIDKNASDFILFKTNLLLDEAKGDPIKKANLIKDIVGSIAKIPDPLKRSVYIRECANRLEIGEDVLVQTTNKLKMEHIRKQQKQEERDRRQAQRNRTTTPPDESWPDAPPSDFPSEIPPDLEHGFPSDEPDDSSFPPTRETRSAPPAVDASSKVIVGDEFQEKDIVRLLMSFGEEEMEEGISVAQYILINVEEVLEAFDHSFYKKIVQDCLEMLKAKTPITQKHFLQSPDQEVSKLAATLLTTPYEYSKNWEEKLMNPLQTQPMPEKNYKKDTVIAVNRIKLRKVNKLLNENQSKIKALQEQGGDAMDMIKQIKVQQKLLQIREEIANLLGTRGAIK